MSLEDLLLEEVLSDRRDLAVVLGGLGRRVAPAGVNMLFIAVYVEDM